MQSTMLEPKARLITVHAASPLGKAATGSLFKPLWDAHQHPRGCVLQPQQHFSLPEPSGAVLRLSSDYEVACATCCWLEEQLTSPCGHGQFLETSSGICPVKASAGGHRGWVCGGSECWSRGGYTC